LVYLHFIWNGEDPIPGSSHFLLTNCQHTLTPCTSIYLLHYYFFIIIIRENFTTNSWYFSAFEKIYLNNKKNYFRVSIFQIFSISTIPYNFPLNHVKILKIPLFFFREKKKKKCYDLGICQNLTEFARIFMSKPLKNFIIFFKKKTHMGILEFW